MGEVEVCRDLLRRVRKLVTALDEVVELLLADREFGLELFGLLGARERLERRQLLRLLARIKDRVQRVVFGRRQRVELVVVATGAGHREALGAAHDHVDAVVDDVRRAVQEATAERQEAERGEVAVILRVFGDLVGGDLQAQELVVGQVLVESVYDPVAISVGVRVTTFFQEDVTLRVGVAGDVEPVAGPAFAEGRRGEEPIDQFLGGLRVLVVDVGGDLIGGRIKAPEGERQATDDDFARRLRIEVEAGRLKFREYEAIKRLADLGFIGGRDDGRGWSLDGLESPVLARVMRDGRRLGRPRQALTHPFGQRGDRLGRKFFIFARHGVDIFSFGVVDGKNETAKIGFARHDDRPEFAALKDQFAGIQTETGLLLLGSVALIAIVGEDWSDLFFEKLQLGGRRRGGLLGSGGREGDNKGAKERPERHRKGIGQGGVPLVPKRCWLSSGCKAVDAVLSGLVLGRHA